MEFQARGTRRRGTAARGRWFGLVLGRNLRYGNLDGSSDQRKTLPVRR